MRKENSEFKTKFISEPGSYLHNTDYFAFVELKDYACYCIADGIDTDEKRESARTAVTAVITTFSEDPGISKSKLRQYMMTAHHALLEEAREMRLEASIVIVISDYKNVRWAHAGNTRLVLMRNGRIKYRTKDTSLSQNMADKSEISLDQLETHEERHNLYCYLGQSGHFSPVISAKRKMDDGDILCLYTRGIWESAGDAELLDAADGVSEPEQVCTNLEDVVLSQQQGVLENYTIAAIFVNKVYRNPKASKNRKMIKIILSVIMAVAVIVFFICFARYRSNQKNIRQMLKYEERGILYLNEVNYTGAYGQFDAAITLADKINAKEGTDAYRHARKVELYNAISGYLSEAMEALTEGEYKKASNKFTSAISNVNTLKEDYGEDISYLNAMLSYQEYADNMKNGIDTLEALNYDEAVEAFTAASKAVDGIDDTTNRNVADDYLNTSNGRKAMKDGKNYESKGDESLNQSMYSQTLTDYNTAMDMYNLAKTSYNIPEADAAISALTVKISNVNEKLSNQTNQEAEAEAVNLEQAAAQAAHKGNTQQAKEAYDSAREVYVKTGNSVKVNAIDAKLEELLYGDDEQKALQAVLDAMTYMGYGSNADAIEELNTAKSIYSNLGKTDVVTSITNTIAAIKQTMNEQNTP